jgi:hypothetical protein
MPVKGPAMTFFKFFVTGFAISCNTAAHRNQIICFSEILSTPAKCDKNYLYATLHLCICTGKINHLWKNEVQ